VLDSSGVGCISITTLAVKDESSLGSHNVHYFFVISYLINLKFDVHLFKLPELPNVLTKPAIPTPCLCPMYRCDRNGTVTRSPCGLRLFYACA
jgi:hypothetical protein